MRRLTQEEFINRCCEIHGNKFDYTNTIYKNIRSNILVRCVKHGEFIIKADNHLSQKQGCWNCFLDKHKLIELKPERINKMRDVHKNKYEYKDKKVTNGFINIECPDHGTFKQYLYFHEYGHGCPECNSSSRGEDKIKKILEDNNITFYRNHQFENCKRNRKLKFDFYIPYLNLCIEYDGEHHFKENKYFGEGNLEYIRENDEIKNIFCNSNNIKLIRIPYYEFKNIDNIIEKLLN
jgi:very-short-patch-repair endonuclease